MEIQKPKLATRTALPWLTVTLAAVAIGERIAPSAQKVFLYNRSLIQDGQWWRLWSGHLTHFSLTHLFWNLVVFVPTGVWLERVYPHYTRLFLVLAPVFISALLWHFDPGLQTYAGISGVAFGALTMLAFFELRRSPPNARKFWGLILLLLVVKLAVEYSSSGMALFVRFPSTFRNVPLSHLAGALCAAGIFALSLIARTKSPAISSRGNAPS